MKNSLNDTPWRDGTLKKSKDIVSLLEERVKTSIPIEGFDLSSTNLENINLVNHGSSTGYKLNNSDFYKANLKNSHCFKVDFSGSSLMKVNFENANLHFANLTNCNLLGCNFKHAKLENVIWDKEVIQERKAKEAKSREEMIDYYQQAEEIYRSLRRTMEADGLFETAGLFFQKEMKMRRKQMPAYSLKRLLSKIVEISCGYGERPLRIVSISMLVILLFSFLFFFSGISYLGNTISFSIDNSLSENINVFFNSLYFSIVTFTTLGYGDITPVGISKVFTSIEALLGGFILALFVVVFVKKMTR